LDKFITKVFANKKIDYDKSKEFGFDFVGGEYVFTTFLMEKQFKLTIKVVENEIITEIFDISNDEPYTLFLVESATGSFVNEVRAKYEKVLNEVADFCCENFIFKSGIAQEVIKYIKEKYGDELEFLWKKFPETAIWRRKDNKKWYGALMTLNKSKLGLESNEKVEIIDLRASVEDVENLVDNVKFFSGYHMNKKHWLTICLDGTVQLNQIFLMIDKSYELTK